MKSQSAMEYLMTYGWAILIIAVVVGALFQLGVFNSNNFAPKAQAGGCQVIRPEGAGSTQDISTMGVCTGEIPEFVAKFSGIGSGSTNSVVAVPSAGVDFNGLSEISITAWVDQFQLTGAPDNVGTIVAKNNAYYLVLT